MLNFIADYRDPAGREYHQAFQVSTDDKRATFWRILWKLRLQGYILTALFIIPGTHTIGQLTCMADKGPTSDQYEIACLDPTFLAASKAGGKRNGERTKRKTPNIPH